jgi:Subtilase family
MSAFQLRLPDDGRPKAQRTKDHKRAALQIERAAGRGCDPELLEEFADKVIEARKRRRRGPSERTYALFERLGGRTGRPILVVANEYVVRADDLSDAERRGLIPPDAVPIDNLDGRVLRVKGSRRSRAARQLPTRVKPHFVTPFGPVMKATVGPEPSDGLRALPQATETTGPVVAVVDTGIDATPRDDGWLGGIPADTGNADLLDDLPPEGRLDLGAGHGTFAAGIIQQLAPAAEIRAYRALDSDGFGTEATVATTMVQAAKDGAAIINLSLGLQTDDDEPPIILEAAVEVVREGWPDVLIVAAAGNFGDSRPCWPAAFKGVTAVAGLDHKLKPTTWTSRGPWVDCSTIGEAVLSTFVAGTERDDVDPDEVADEYPPSAWAIWTGTSFAAPQISGAVAQVAADTGLVPRDALARLLEGRPEKSNFGRVLQVLQPI